ncbi:MAG: hypothetical protein ACYTEN_06735 [Planctomycetota bacterium]|jgi:hypothetical protein
MKNPKVQFVLVTVLLIAAGLLLIPSLTQATPKGVPAWRVDEPQRDGYSRSFVVDANSVLFTVPEGRESLITNPPICGNSPEVITIIIETCLTGP